MVVPPELGSSSADASGLCFSEGAHFELQGSILGETDGFVLDDLAIKL